MLQLILARIPLRHLAVAIRSYLLFYCKKINHVSQSLVNSAEVSALTVDILENQELIPAFGTKKHEIKIFQQILDR